MASGERIFTFEGISLPSYWGGNYVTQDADAAYDHIRDVGASAVSTHLSASGAIVLAK